MNDMYEEYKKAIERGFGLPMQQKEMVWSTNGPTRDMRASYLGTRSSGGRTITDDKFKHTELVRRQQEDGGK